MRLTLLEPALRVSRRWVTDAWVVRVIRFRVDTGSGAKAMSRRFGAKAFILPEGIASLRKIAAIPGLVNVGFEPAMAMAINEGSTGVPIELDPEALAELRSMGHDVADIEYPPK